jgi:hypothetical protein
MVKERGREGVSGREKNIKRWSEKIAFFVTDLKDYVVIIKCREFNWS